jgi:hypothetical protein
MALVAKMLRTCAPLSVLLLLSLGAACVDLTKVDPGPRFIDDFDDGGAPSWTRFSPWTCDDFVGSGGPDAGAAADAGIADSGRSDEDAAVASSCHLSLESPGATDRQALKSVFTLDDPLDGVRQTLGTEIVTHTISGTVDLTGFTQLVFSAILETAALPVSPLPGSTQFQAGLGCSTFQSDPLATQDVTYVLGAGWAQFRLSLSEFHLNDTTHNQSCLALVDSIHFIVKARLADGASTGGTLHIDNISLQN